jgi:hypothetical protein
MRNANCLNPGDLFQAPHDDRNDIRFAIAIFCDPVPDHKLHFLYSAAHKSSDDTNIIIPLHKNLFVK